jgi:hypothetical protein
MSKNVEHSSAKIPKELMERFINLTWLKFLPSCLNNSLYLRLRPRYFLVAFYWASGAATLLCAMLDPANIVGLFYLVRFYTYTTISF